MDKQTDEMVVSIIIPTYNVEQYIEECLESIAQQTYKEIECIIVDDCGHDRSIEIAQSFIDNYVGPIHFLILHRDKNGGLSAARNSGIETATGDYVYFLDSDDILIPTCIEELVSIASRYPGADMVQAGISTFDGVASSDIESCNLPEYVNDRRCIKQYYMLDGALPVSACSRLYKSSFLNDNDLRFHEGIIHEDVEFSFLVAQKIDAVAICRHNSYLYRIQREGSIITSSKKQYAFESRMLVLNGCIDSFDNIERDIQIKAVVLKILTYLAITDTEVIRKDMYADVCKRLAGAASFPYSWILTIFFLFPVSIQKTIVFRHIVSFLFNIKL